MLPIARPLPLVLRTGRLLLRRPGPDDAEACSSLEGDPRTARYRPGGPLDRQASDDDLAQNLCDWDEDGLGYWFVERHGEIIGRTGQRRIDTPTLLLPGVEPERLLNTYYRFTPSSWGTGLGTEAAQAALDATRAAGLSYPAVAITTVDNLTAQRLAQRLGMTFHRRVPVHGLPDSVELRVELDSPA